MKLLLCLNCQDVFKLHKQKKQCNCGKTSGRYLNDINAEFSGEFAVPLGIANSTLDEAIRYRPKDGWGSRFDAFVIPKKCNTMKKV